MSNENKAWNMNVSEMADAFKTDFPLVYHEIIKRGRQEAIQEAKEKIRGQITVFIEYSLDMSGKDIAERAIVNAKAAVLQMLDKIK